MSHSCSKYLGKKNIVREVIFPNLAFKKSFSPRLGCVMLYIYINKARTY